MTNKPKVGQHVLIPRMDYETDSTYFIEVVVLQLLSAQFTWVTPTKSDELEMHGITLYLGGWEPYIIKGMKVGL